jgi:hypothetical protein
MERPFDDNIQSSAGSQKCRFAGVLERKALFLAKRSVLRFSDA